MIARVSRLISIALIVAIALVSADALCASVCAWTSQAGSAPPQDAPHSCHDAGPSPATTILSADATCMRPHLDDAPARLTSLTVIPSVTQTIGGVPALSRGAPATPRAVPSSRPLTHQNVPLLLRI